MTVKQRRESSCPTELACSMYADGELAASEARAMRAHLALCPGCLDLVQAFQEEKASIVKILEDADAFLAESEPVHTRTPSPILASQLMGLVIGTALLLRTGLDLIIGLQLPWGLAWLNPLQISGQLSLLFSSSFYFIREGGSIMESLASTAGLAVLASLLFYLVFFRLQRSSRISAITGALVLAVVLTAPANAIEIKSGEHVAIEADQVIEDTFIAFGRTVRIDGVVTGDLIAFAESIDIQGSVRGDTFFFGQNIEIEGEVGGGVAVFGEVIRLGDSVGQSVFGFGKSILTRREAAIGGDIFAFGDQINVGGSVARNLTVFGNRLSVAGEVLRDVTFSGNLAAIQSTASIGGHLDVDVPREENLQVDSISSVEGSIMIDVPDESQEDSWSIWPYLFAVLWLAAAYISGLIFFWALPAFRRQPLVDLQSILVSAGTGIVLLIALPVAAVMFAVTLIGLPAGMVTAVMWLLGLYLSKIIVAHFLGTSILRTERHDMRSLALPLLVGLVLVLIAVSLPYLGWLINLLLVIVGLGAMGQILYRTFRNRSAAA